MCCEADFSSRRRHVRCDEQHPCCRNCERLGISCHRPSKKWRQSCPRQIHPVGGLSGPVAPISVSGLSPLRGAQVLYFDLFRYEVIFDVAGIGYHELWTTTIMRESLHDECIQHSVLALGALALALEEDGHGGSIPPKNFRTNAAIKQHYNDALRHHGKAISIFTKRINDNGVRNSPRFIFLATIVVAAFELLHCSRATVGTLILHGQNLLNICAAQLGLNARPATLLSPRNATSTLDTELENLDDMISLIPRLTMVHGLIPFLPISQRLAILGFEGFDTELPDIQIGLHVLFRMWREHCTVMKRLDAYIEWAAQQGVQKDINSASAALANKYDCIIAWGNVIKHHIQQNLNHSQMQFLNAMNIQHLCICTFAFSNFLTDTDAYEMSRVILDEVVAQTDRQSRAWRVRMLLDIRVPMLSSLERHTKSSSIRRDCGEAIRRLNRMQSIQSIT